MAQLVNFIRDDPHGEYVVIDDEDQDDLGLINDYGLQGYELHARLIWATWT